MLHFFVYGNLRKLAKIMKCVPTHKEGTKCCTLCLEEKLQILMANKRSEIISKCRHVNTCYLWNAQHKQK